MTALCGGGPSQGKPGFPSIVVNASASLEAFLAITGLETLAAVLAPLLATETFDLTVFCTVDPPADPGLTAADAFDVLNFADPTVSQPAIARLKQWFHSWYWFQVCECASGTTPAAPTPSNPGPIATSPGLPAGITPPCFSGVVTDTIASSYPNATRHDLTPQLLPTDGPAVTTPNGLAGFDGPFPQQMWPIPAGVNSIELRGAAVTLDADDVPPLDWLAGLNWFDNSGNWLHGITFFQPTAGAPSNVSRFRPGDTVWPVGATYYGIVSQRSGHSGAAVDTTVTVSSTVGCAGPALQSPCCPPDPTVEARLNQLLGLVQSIWASLPVPLTSYAEGTVHDALAGNGSFVLVGAALAIKIEVLTIPSFVGQEDGDPVRLFDVGYVTTITAEAPQATTRLQYASQLVPLPALTESIGYSLSPGVNARITELVRGP